MNIQGYKKNPAFGPGFLLEYITTKIKYKDDFTGFCPQTWGKI
jgi:hypothetical protein